MKWFVPAARPIGREPTECAACGGRLIAIERVGGNGPGAPEHVDFGH